MAEVHDFDRIVFGEHAIKDLEPILADDLAADAGNARPDASGWRRMNSTAA